MPESVPVRSLGAREAATVAGNAATRILASPTPRSGILLHNASPTLSLWLRLAEQGAAPPTISASYRDYVVPPENTIELEVSELVDVYAQNASGGATTSPYTATEVKR
jgi:hypothetical protein